MRNEIVRIMNDEVEFFTTLNVKDKEGRKDLLILSQNEPDSKISEYIGKQITFNAVYMEKVQIEDSIKKGKVVDAIRTVIRTPEGETLTATSEGFAKSVMMILNCLGDPNEWDKEYWFEVKQVETRAGRRYYKLQLVDNE